MVGLGCSSAVLVTDLSELGETAAGRIDNHQVMSRQETSAQLVQVTIRSSELTRRFNLEVYHSDDITAFYTGGFAGRGSFKGLLDGLALRLALPREKQYYDGSVSQLVEPDLGEYEYVVMRLRELLSGNLICESADSTAGDVCGKWNQELYSRNNTLKRIVYRSTTDPVAIEAELFKFSDDFPYFQIRRAKVSNSETGASIKLKFIEQRYGPVPDVKFSFPDIAGWDRVDRFELK
jgi:hypothetical protein